jgi:hypothetical protein
MPDLDLDTDQIITPEALLGFAETFPPDHAWMMVSAETWLSALYLRSEGYARPRVGIEFVWPNGLKYDGADRCYRSTSWFRTFQDHFIGVWDTAGARRVPNAEVLTYLRDLVEKRSGRRG